MTQSPSNSHAHTPLPSHLNLTTGPATFHTKAKIKIKLKKVPQAQFPKYYIIAQPHELTRVIPNNYAFSI